MPALVAGIHVFSAFHDLLKLKTWITDKPRPRLCQYRARRDSAVDVEALFGARPEANPVTVPLTSAVLSFSNWPVMGWTRRALASRSRKPAWGCENFVVLIACLYRSGLKKHIDTNRAGKSLGHKALDIMSGEALTRAAITVAVGPSHASASAASGPAPRPSCSRLKRYRLIRLTKPSARACTKAIGIVSYFLPAPCVSSLAWSFDLEQLLCTRPG